MASPKGYTGLFLRAVVAEKPDWRTTEKWRLLRQADEPSTALILIVAFFALLWWSLQPLFNFATDDAFFYYGVTSLMAAGVIVKLAKARLGRPAFVLHELDVLMSTEGSDGLRAALDWFFESLAMFIENSFGHEDPGLFILAAIDDSGKLGEDESPESLEEVFAAIKLDLIDKATARQSVDRGLSKMSRLIRTAVTQEKFQQKLRLALRDLYVESKATYRASVSVKPQNEFIAWLDQHPVLGAGIVNALVIILLKFGFGI